MDMVNHPAHYTSGKYEVIDIIEDSLTKDQVVGYYLGNITKYLLRCQHKGNMLQDLKKADWYLDRLTNFLGADELKNTTERADDCSKM